MKYSIAIDGPALLRLRRLLFRLKSPPFRFKLFHLGNNILSCRGIFGKSKRRSESADLPLDGIDLRLNLLGIH